MAVSAGRAKRKAKVELDMAVMKFQTHVEKVATQVLDRTVTLRLSRVDQLRLLNLKFWVIEYKVSLRYILSVLLPLWENAKHIQRKKPAYGLGIRVATLIGARSRQLLEEQMQKDFPAGENEFEFEYPQNIWIFQNSKIFKFFENSRNSRKISKNSKQNM